MNHPNPADQSRARCWADTLFQRGNFYIVDTETTGFHPTDEIIQIGIIDGSGQTVMETLLRPRKHIPARASMVHGIYDDDVADAPLFDEVYEQVQDLFADSDVVAYNMDFDWKMFAQTAHMYQVGPMHSGPRHCAMKQYAVFRGAWNPRFRGYRWHKLTNACAQEAIPVMDAHSAVGDCRMTLELMRRMAEGATC